MADSEQLRKDKETLRILTDVQKEIGELSATGAALSAPIAHYKKKVSFQEEQDQ